MADLIAPAHLRGRMPRSKPEALRSERISWAAKVSREGRLNIEIAAALGITEHSVGAILKHVGGCQRERRARKQADCVLRAAVRAMGGDPDDFMYDSPERRKGVRRAKNEGQRDGE